MSLWPPHLYRKEGARAGIDEAILAAAIAQAQPVQGRGLPAILTLKHLCVMADVPYKRVRSIVARQTDDYAAFRVRKRRGGYRTIAAPKPDLKKLQRWISGNILHKIPVHHASYAYAYGKSAVDCARQHCGAQWLIKLDLEQFFESISEIDAFRVFREHGYQPLVSFELARVCTRTLPRRARLRTWFGRRRRWSNRQARRWFGGYRIRAYSVERIGHVPQGAPTSPMLSNLVARDIDAQLFDYAATLSLAYTRYSDDIVFSSGRDDFRRLDAVAIVRHVQDVLMQRGFRIQKAKTNIVPPGARKVVLGLVVNSDQPTLSRETVDEIRQHLYYSRKYGAGEHSARRGFDSTAGFIRYLEGRINYARHVDDEFGSWARAQLSDICQAL